MQNYQSVEWAYVPVLIKFKKAHYKRDDCPRELSPYEI